MKPATIRKGEAHIAVFDSTEGEYIRKIDRYGLRFFTPGELLDIIRLCTSQLDIYREVGLTTDAEVEKINDAEDERFEDWLSTMRRNKK